MLVCLPIFIPLLASVLCLLVWRSPRAQQWINLSASAALLLASIALLQWVSQHDYLVLQMGEWPAPYGISLVADRLAAIMVLLAAVTGLAIAVFSLAATPEGHRKFGYYPLMQLLLAGVCGSFVTGDLFNLFVWFEVMLLASFALITLGGERAQMEGAIKDVTLNLFSSALFLSAVGLLYGTLGTLNMADIAQKASESDQQGMLNVLAVLFMLVFGIKAAAFPLFFWLPASYHTPLVAISALFAGLLTKVGVYALYRVFTLIFNGDPGFTHNILLWVAGATMLTGVLGAAAQFEFRRILSFHIISQIGYMLLGLALFTPLALVGGIFYLMHHIIVKANLFLVSGIVYRLLGSYDLARLGGLYRTRPALSVLFLIPALSLAGLPPLSGFFAKFILIRASLELQEWAITVVALVVSLLTLFSMLKIWSEVFWKDQPEGAQPQAELGKRETALYYLPVLALVLCTLAIGLNPQPIYELAEAAAMQLLDPAGYIDAVLGGAP